MLCQKNWLFQTNSNFPERVCTSHLLIFFNKWQRKQDHQYQNMSERTMGTTDVPNIKQRIHNGGNGDKFFHGKSCLVFLEENKLVTTTVMHCAKLVTPVQEDTLKDNTHKSLLFCWLDGRYWRWRRMKRNKKHRRLAKTWQESVWELRLPNWGPLLSHS